MKIMSKIDLARQLIESGISEEARAALEKEFPELKESEDERIRQMIENTLRDAVTSERVSETSYREMLTYLEKQKEEKNYRKLYEDIANSEWFKKMYVGKSLGCDYEQKEQKLAEWSEEEEKDIQEASDYLRDYANNCVQGGNSKLYLQSLADRIESLRPQHQSPSLSDKEILCLKRALDYLRKEHNRYAGEDFTNEIAVLEYLITHPVMVYPSQPHWKPSEEQMEALDVAIKMMEENSICSGALVPLYFDLKLL